MIECRHLSTLEGNISIILVRSLNISQLVGSVCQLFVVPLVFFFLLFNIRTNAMTSLHNFPRSPLIYMYRINLTSFIIEFFWLILVDFNAFVCRISYSRVCVSLALYVDLCMSGYVCPCVLCLFHVCILFCACACVCLFV